MIDAKNIMAGNWFEHNANWCFRSPENLKPFLFQWEERDWYALGECTMSLDDVSPIPLSPDILEKCGFETNALTLDINENWFLGMYGGKMYLQVEKHVKHEKSIVECIDLPHIEYLHQLQNLYYSLTNQELNIQL